MTIAEEIVTIEKNIESLKAQIADKEKCLEVQLKASIKPCPFCGDQPVIEEYSNGAVKIQCDINCKAQPRLMRASLRGAVEAWNTRA